jgi:hypothetical protein
MKKLVFTVFSILLFTSMSNTFAASTDDLVLVSAGEMVCAGGPPSRHIIRNVNDDVYLLINSIAITDGSGVVRFDSSINPIARLQDPLGPQQGFAFRIIDALELAGHPEEHVRDLRGPWQTTMSFSLKDGIGMAGVGLAPFVRSVHFAVDGRVEPWSFRDLPVAAFSSRCRYKALIEKPTDKTKDK